MNNKNTPNDKKPKRVWILTSKDTDKSVKIQKVRENGVILYDVASILSTPAAKRHLQILQQMAEEPESSVATK